MMPPAIMVRDVQPIYVPRRKKPKPKPKLKPKETPEKRAEQLEKARLKRLYAKPIVYNVIINRPPPVPCPLKRGQKPKVIRGNKIRRDFCHLVVEIAILYGILTRLNCEICGDTPGQAHHTNYFEPSNVQWLCWRHHRKLHHATPLKCIPGAF